MSIASRIESIEEHIGNAYDSIEALGVDITGVNKNIENISSSIDGIYDTLPKVTGEGESITLDGTIKGRLKSTLKGNTSQNGTPTPSTPIPVNVVSGDNTIKIEGKNKFPSDIYNQLDISGTAQLQQNGYYKINFPSNKTIMEGQFEENTQYTISASAYGGASGNSGVFGFNYTDGTSETKGINQTTAYNYFITSSANKTIRNIQITYGSANTTYIKNLQLEKGSTATTYDEPYVSSSYQVNLPVENLFNKDGTNIINGYLSGTTILSYVGNRVVYIPIKQGETYTINKIVGNAGLTYAYTTNEPVISGTTFGLIVLSDKTTTITAPANANYLAITIYRDADSSYTPEEVLGGLQIEEGTKANSYTPYGTTPIKMRGIGTYEDYFVRNSGKNLFDEEQLLEATGWAKNSNGYYTGLASDLKTKYGTTTDGFTFANTFKENTQYTISCNFYSSVSNGNNRFYFEYTDGTSSLEAWNDTSPTNKSITSTAGKTIRKICFDCNVNAKTIYFKNLMLNEGTTATTYEPYGVGKWYLHKEIGKWEFNGSTIIDVSGLKGIYTPSMPTDKINASNKGAYFTRAKFILSSATKVENSFYENPTNFLVIGSSTDTLETLKTKFNGGLLYYILATPTDNEVTYQPLIEQLNNFEKAMSYNGQTNISQVNNDLPFIISASALKEWSE